MVKNNKYQKSKRRKKRRKALRTLKNHYKIVAGILTTLAAIVTFCINYYEKIYETRFSETYFSMRITNNLKSRLINNDYSSYYQDMLKYPTLNNELDNLLENDIYQDYYVVYFILRENGEYEAKDVTITFLNTKNDKLESINVDFPIVKNQGVKVPIAICPLDYLVPSDYMSKKFDFNDCIKPVYKPVKISFHNHFLFSKQEYKIRELNMYQFVIEGEAVAAVGADNEKIDKKWYLK